MRYRLRTLLIILGIGPPLLAGVWLYKPPLEELVGGLTMLGILSLAYWSLGYWASQRSPKRARAFGRLIRRRRSRTRAC